MADIVSKWIQIKVSTIFKVDAVYRFCFKLLTNRNVGTVLIDYNSDVEYYESTKSIKVPDNLLKS